MQQIPDNTFENNVLRGNVMAKECPSRQVLNHLTSRWGVMVMISLLSGEKRFSELRRTIDGVSERMLAQTLQQLEADAMVHRKDFQTVPPHVEYSLTELGLEATSHLKGLVNWLEFNLPRILEQRVEQE